MTNYSDVWVKWTWCGEIQRWQPYDISPYSPSTIGPPDVMVTQHRLWIPEDYRDGPKHAMETQRTRASLVDAVTYEGEDLFVTEGELAECDRQPTQAVHVPEEPKS